MDACDLTPAMDDFPRHDCLSQPWTAAAPPLRGPTAAPLAPAEICFWSQGSAATATGEPLHQWRLPWSVHHGMAEPQQGLISWAHGMATGELSHAHDAHHDSGREQEVEP